MCNRIGVPDAQLMEGLFAPGPVLLPRPGPGERTMLTVATRAIAAVARQR
jgi:hypothetical protein